MKSICMYVVATMLFVSSVFSAEPIVDFDQANTQSASIMSVLDDVSAPPPLACSAKFDNQVNFNLKAMEQITFTPNLPDFQLNRLEKMQYKKLTDSERTYLIDEMLKSSDVKVILSRFHTKIDLTTTMVNRISFLNNIILNSVTIDTDVGILYYRKFTGDFGKRTNAFLSSMKTSVAQFASRSARGAFPGAGTESFHSSSGVNSD